MIRIITITNVDSQKDAAYGVVFLGAAVSS
jgi:hypothetical protein